MIKLNFDSPTLPPIFTRGRGVKSAIFGPFSPFRGSSFEKKRHIWNRKPALEASAR